MKTRRRLFPKRKLMGGAPPEWYAIPEIRYADYVQCLRPLYKILEKKHKSKTEPDVFLKTILGAFSNMTAEQWDEAENNRLYEKSLSMEMGDFHEELMGKFPGYETLPRGHETGVDVRKRDDTEFFEVKNRDNTMNSGSAESVVRKLTKLAESGKKSVLVMVNSERKTVPRFKAPPTVDVMSGKQAYQYLSGRSSFFDDLVKTLNNTFMMYDSYEKLESSTVGH